VHFSELAQAYAALERTTRHQPTMDILTGLLRSASPAEVHTLVYLTQGKLAPDWMGIELGLAEKSLVPVIAQVSGRSAAAVASALHRKGDLGTVAEAVLAEHEPGRPPLGVSELQRELTRISATTGTGSAAKKAERFAGLLRRASPLEVRFLVRLAAGKLRLGVGDATLRSALAQAFGVPAQALERAYHICSDLGLVAEVAARGGAEAVQTLHVEPGRPIRPMLAQRLADPAEILRKFGGQAAAEFKYDGERIQIHRLRSGEIELFSRRIERITSQYPDVVERARRHLHVQAAIVDVEVVAIDPRTGRFRPFQVLMQRRRKYGIDEAIERVPVAVFAFDLLHLDGEDLLDTAHSERRRLLGRALHPGPGFSLATGKLVRSVPELEALFSEALAAGLEGLVCKHPGGLYHAGARGWQWIKLKREYQEKLADTFDLVVVGAFWGRGNRAGTYGSLLLAAYDADEEVFRTVTRVGSGFTAADLAALPRLLAPLQTPRPDDRVDSRMKADVWFQPARVMEVLAAELTLSPAHTAAWGAIRPGAGLALRFPRFTGRWREDKGPEDATTVGELIEMYRRRT
jgi:DNA ligase-1